MAKDAKATPLLLASKAHGCVGIPICWLLVNEEQAPSLGQMLRGKEHQHFEQQELEFCA